MVRKTFIGKVRAASTSMTANNLKNKFKGNNLPRLSSN